MKILATLLGNICLQRGRNLFAHNPFLLQTFSHYPSLPKTDRQTHTHHNRPAILSSQEFFIDFGLVSRVHQLPCHFFVIFRIQERESAAHSVGFPGGSAVKNLPAMQEPQETWVRSLGQEDPLEQEMATHSSILAWRIPWTEEPSGLQSIESQRVRQA